MNDMFTTILLQGVGTVFGVFAAYTIIKVDVAVTKKIADMAIKNSDTAHTRLDSHIERFHSK